MALVEPGDAQNAHKVYCILNENNPKTGTMLVIAIAFAAVAVLVFVITTRSLRMEPSTSVFVTFLVTAMLAVVTIGLANLGALF